MSGKVESFRERARVEADRYGSDPWVFVRELLQNARDAGATQVVFTVERGDGVERISCRDDGEGMSFAESRRYLFTLYASSKRRMEHQAGRFGVGFWSIMRFQPSRIVIRSRALGDDAWEVELDGALEEVAHRGAQLTRGTEIVLERPGRDTRPAGLTELVLSAARNDGRFLSCRDEPARRLTILVNGQRADSPFGLGAPSVAFSRRGLRGVVGLGKQQQVELFVHGLRVRTAASLDDLLSEEPGPRQRKATLPELPQGLVPQVLLDSDQLEVLLARSDAREDRRLRRYVAIARSELARLVRRQLDRSAPASLPRRLLESLQRLWWQRWARIGAGIAAGLLLLFVLALTAARLLPRSVSGPPPAETEETVENASTGPPVLPPAPLPYHDLAGSYRGPAVDAVSATTSRIDLRYHPASRDLLLAALLIDHMAEDGLPLHTLVEPGQAEQYQGGPCAGACIGIDLGIDSAAGLLRLPVPTGFAVDPGSVRLSTGATPSLLASAAGEPVLVLPTRFAGTVQYRVGPAPPQAPPPYAEHDWPVLPAAIARRAAALGEQPVAERIVAALAMVRSLVAYDRSPAVISRYRASRSAGDGVLTRTLAIGAGDCDVQNSLLVAVLREAGVPARLAVGFLGRDGVAAPGQHAWVELLDARGHWRVADASVAPGGRSAQVSTSSQLPRPVPRSGRPSGAGEGGDGISARGAATDPDPSPDLQPSRVWPAAGAAMLCLAAIVVLSMAGVAARQLGSKRTLHLQQQTDMAGLLDGALRRPEAFQQVGSLFTRPVVPLLAGRAMSLGQAQRRAARGRLLRSRGDSRLARRAAARGARIIDTGTREGTVVAELLGAADVDLWDQLLAGRQPAPFLDAVNRVLRQAGERWRLSVAGGALEPLTTVDLPALGRGRRQVVLACETALCAAASDCFARRPWQAVLLVLDAAAQHLDLPARQRSRLLAVPAARAISERVRE